MFNGFFLKQPSFADLTKTLLIVVLIRNRGDVCFSPGPEQGQFWAECLLLKEMLHNLQTGPEPREEAGSAGICASEKIVFRSVEALRPNPRNARTHPKRKIRDLANIIVRFGFVVPIIVDENDMILAGHARYEAAKLLGLSSVPTICVDRLSDAEKRAFALADNKFGERAGWNRGILVEELKDLAILLPSLDLDLSLTGFESGEIDVLFSELAEDKPEPEDEIVPTAGPTVTHHGELWILGNHRVLCGDARDPAGYVRLLENRRVDACFTDPPFNVAVQGHVQGRGRHKHPEFAFASGEMSESEFAAFLEKCANSSRRKSLARRRGTITARLLSGLRAELTGSKGPGIVAFARRLTKFEYRGRRIDRNGSAKEVTR